MAPRSRVVGLVAVVLVLAAAAEGNAFPHPHEGFMSRATEGQSDHPTTLDVAALDAQLERAMGSALGCGGESSQARFAEIEKVLLPMWQSLPKNGHGRVVQRSLRYLAHRYFMQSSNIIVKGIESFSVMNETSQTHAQILSDRVPAVVETMLEGQRAELGFTLQDAVMMVVTVEELIYDDEAKLLAKVYKQGKHPTNKILDRKALDQLLEKYMVNWMLGEDATPDTLEALSDKATLEGSFPHWNFIAAYATGRVDTLDYSRQHPLPQPEHMSSTLKKQYSFADAHEVVAGITHSFASFWNSECSAMKEQLMDMDPDMDGRVPLQKFYAAAMESEWRFGESEVYLRDMGTLDESSMWRGKQVLITNYLHAPSNCIVSTDHYSVCCPNECQDMLGEIEVAIGEPMAAPTEILEVVGNLTVHMDNLEEMDPRRLEGTLTVQLEEIAIANGGKVPLHGRRFAQWLHFVFPHECAYPHKAGQFNPQTPLKYGELYIAPPEEMKKYANSKLNASAEAPEDVPGLSSFIPDEEHWADYSVQFPLAAGEAMSPEWVIGGVVLLAAVAALASKTGLDVLAVPEDGDCMSQSSDALGNAVQFLAKPVNHFV